MKHIISLGAGVQSSTMALMAAHGEITPMPDAAIFADTQAEPASVYLWLDWLEKQLPFPVHRVTFGNLGEDSLRIRRSKNSGKLYSVAMIPLFIKSFADGEGMGMLPRKCTRDYKVVAINRKIKKICGLTRATKRTPVLAQTWLGISRDEILRMKPSMVPYVENGWPLIEMGITRQGCKDWMRERGYPMPPRSACNFCPYHNDDEWQRMKDEEPGEFAKAVDWERRYQSACEGDEVIRGVPFLHRSLVPLSEVNFRASGNSDQLNMFTNECEGMCGV